jgi:hypothetical protein
MTSGSRYTCVMQVQTQYSDITYLLRRLVNYVASLDCHTNSRYTHLDTLRNNGRRNVHLRLGSHSVPFSGGVRTIQRKCTHVHKPALVLREQVVQRTSICYDVWIRLKYHQHSNRPRHSSSG